MLIVTCRILATPIKYVFLSWDWRSQTPRVPFSVNSNLISSWSVHSPEASFNNIWNFKIYVCVCVCVWAESLQSCLALCNPVDCNSPGFSVHGILQAIILQWVAIPFSRGSSQPRNWTCRQIFYSVSYHNVTRVQLWRPEIGIATILLANIKSVFWFCQMSY